MYIAYYKKTKTYKTSEIAEMFNVTRALVNYSLNYYKVDFEDNKHIREQIMYGSILGDGYLQKIDNIYKYRESHSVKEKDYAVWKYLMLDDWTATTRVIDKNKNNNECDAVELYTSVSASSDIEKYYNMTIDEVIDKIDIYGLIIFLLDDGWYTDHSSTGNYCISSGELKEHQLNKIIEKFKEYNIECSLVGKRKDISISSKSNLVLFSYLYQMFQFLDIDIINKKFGKTINILKEIIA